MRLRQVPRPVFDPPPLPLRRWCWSGPRPQPPGESTGAGVYGSRADWLAARRVWEHEHGQTVGSWYAEASRLAREERGFGGWAEMLAYRPDPDEEEDPDAW